MPQSMVEYPIDESPTTEIGVSRDNMGNRIMTTATSRGTVEQMLACLPEDGARFRTICASVSDWSGIFESEQQDSVWGILYDHLGEAGIELPAAVKKSVEQRLVREWLALLGARTALEEALSSLHTAGIRGVVVTGPGLAARLCLNPSVRSWSDISL